MGLLAACGSDAALPDARPALPDATSADPDAAAGTDPFTILYAPDDGAAVGYLADGSLPVVTFRNYGRPTQCRSGHVPEVAALPFTPCPDPDAAGVSTYALVATPGKSDGAYRVEIQHRDADGTSAAFVRDIYLSRSLTGAGACGPGLGGWPSDATWFAAATATMTVPNDRQLPSWADAVTRQGSLPHAQVFAGLSLQAPRYQLPFAGVGDIAPFISSKPEMWNGDAVVETTADFTLPIVSLRHRIVANPDNTLIAIYRTYESRTAARHGSPGQCGVNIYLGKSHNWQFLDWNRFACDVLVLNAAGEGVCLARPEGAPAIVAYSRTMVYKLTGGVAPDGGPGHQVGVFGPKFIDDAGLYPDEYVEVPHSDIMAQPVIVRP